MTDKVQTKVYLPPEVKERIDRDERSNSDVVETAVVEHYGSRDKSAVEMRIQNKLDELEAAENTLQAEEENVEELRETVERLRRRKSEMEDERERERRETWERALQNITPPDLRSIDTEDWAPEEGDDAVKHYAAELNMTPAEFVEQYPDKREELTA